jgi:hypothetical protein
VSEARKAASPKTIALRPAIVAVLGCSVLFVLLAIWQTISPFVPHVFYGAAFDLSKFSRITRMYAGELPRGMHIAIGEHVLEHADGDILRGYRLRVPKIGDEVHVSTPDGIVAMSAVTTFYPKRDRVPEALRQASTAVAIVCAALFFMRRPGLMSFAFWLWALIGLGGGDLDYSLDRLPRPVGLGFDLLFWGLNYSGFALISFALRFPTGSVSSRLRWLDGTVWAVLGCSFVVEVADRALYLAGRTPAQVSADIRLAALPMIAAAGVLLWKQAHSGPFERSKIAWASAAFVGAAVARATAFMISASDQYQYWRLIEVAADLLPLLAIYPILRYRLFDLGFVVSRAAVYSALCLAAFGTLAAANWFAQHFVTERLAFVLQPVAAIAIGLGYFRVRGWVQNLIERVLFRERFAAEQHMEATIRALPLVARSESVDDVLVSEVARTLHLASAALFRTTDQEFERVAAVGWDGDLLLRISRDDLLAQRISGEDRIVQLASMRWEAEGLPAPPNDPVLALGIVRRSALSAIVLYGRHDNGTEIEPDELKVLRRVGDAAAIAYETAEAEEMRERMKVLEARLREFESDTASA